MKKRIIKKFLYVAIITSLPILISLFIFCLNNNEKQDLWDILLVIGTIYLGLLAAFQDFVRGLFYRPELDCELILEPPHCHLLENNLTYYIRFKILNNGNVSANNVEVFLKSVIDKNNKYVSLSASNLLWSSIKLERLEKENPFSSYRMYWDYLSPNTYQYCNLGEISQPLLPEQDRSGLSAEQRLSYKFNLSLYWKANDGSFSLLPGKYTFELIIAASNAKPISKIYEIEFTGVWNKNEKIMFSESIKLLKNE
ncbi:MAG: hypothetical protein HY959_06170 [Ignavibacteriae bacterium]|nr:hypothetical protein [Ignavibacteriota bacterium]